MTSLADHDKVALQGHITAARILDACADAPIGQLSISRSAWFGVKAASALPALRSVERLWLWCAVTRPAMRHVIATTGLRVLDLLQIKGPGRLRDFADAHTLEVFRCNHCLREDDLLELSRCPSLREIGVQGADLTPRAWNALLRLPALQSLDLEGTAFDDRMAAGLLRAPALSALDLGATRITRVGLAHIARMHRLRSLDLWQTALEVGDLEPLADLPALEYLSFGEVEGAQRHDAGALVQRLVAMPALRRVWIDGIALSAAQRATLVARFPDAKIT